MSKRTPTSLIFLPFARFNSKKSHELTNPVSKAMIMKNFEMFVRFILNYIILSIYFAHRINSIPVQLNEFIDVFPRKYFVKIYFEEIIFENLGSSNVPVTLLWKNEIEVNKSLSISWCRLFPVSSFIGVRSEKTINMIFINITKCYISWCVACHQCQF
jgi:hypothetical protein